MTESASANQRHYCMAVGPRTGPRGTRAAVLKDFAWEPGQTITVRFLSGSQELRARVAAVAAEWTTATTANLRFVVVDRGRADIRISFVAGDGSWSTIGTVAGQVAQAEATMNYGWLTDDSPEDELRRVVLHEFGHAIGLIHEHQNPQHPIDWNRDAVIRDLSGPPNSWDLETIEHNMFAHYTQAEVEATNTDPKSIMMYPIPLAWTNDGFSAALNDELSPLDRELVSRSYPAQ